MMSCTVPKLPLMLGLILVAVGYTAIIAGMAIDRWNHGLANKVASLGVITLVAALVCLVTLLARWR